MNESGNVENMSSLKRDVQNFRFIYSWSYVDSTNEPGHLRRDLHDLLTEVEHTPLQVHTSRCTHIVHSIYLFIGRVEIK